MNFRNLGKINVSLFKDNMPILGAEKWKEVRTENSHLSLQDVLVSIGMTKPAFAQVDATTAKYSTGNFGIYIRRCGHCTVDHGDSTVH